MKSSSGASIRPIAGPSGEISSPAWLESMLGAAVLRVIDVRVDSAPSAEESGPRLRARGRLELAPIGVLHADGWLLPRDRRPRRGPFTAFSRAHIPGAVALDVRAELFDEAGEVVTAPELAMVMSRLGVGDGHTIVLVDDGKLHRARAAQWVLARYGRRGVTVLDGGFTRWALERRPLTEAIIRHPAASFTARVSA